ncbi:MAG: beta-galactosidase, partial [Terriglobia bacterium]
MNSSRRKFLQAALAGPLAAEFGRKGLLSFGSPGLLMPGTGQTAFENPQIIHYDPACFTLHGRDTFVMSGCFHYTRCPKELWGDRLMKFKQAGFNTIETYVFWNYHEPIEGQIDMSELESFIQLVEQRGFYMIIRPGPYVCAEWDAGGFPHWITAKQFPLRSAAPESIQTSQHWYDSVLPVIQRHTITNGGPIIMIQVENEYDYWRLPDAEKRTYITALAEMVWKAGIDIPIITNWCKQARENSDPVMARIMDTADFYPRWDIVKQTLGPLARLRAQEPDCPVGVTELQGGWFSKFGGKLSVDQPGVDAAQLNMLAKTMIEHGVTYYSFYMGFGGTNFEHAAKTLTTTYDYAAPIREPGGLWEKYYAARGIGAFLSRFGPLVARSEAASGAECTNPQVSVTERMNGSSGFLFIRENANAHQQYKLTFPNPASPTHRLATVPRQGQLSLGAREMKMLPVEVALPGSQLHYTTAEMLGAGINVDRVFLVIYDERGRTAEIAVSTSREPEVEGGTVYQYWDSDLETLVMGINVERIENMWLVNGELQIIALPRDRALRTWIASYPIKVVPDMEGKGPIDVPFMTDCALMGETGSHHQRAWADLHFTPGTHHLTTLWPSEPDDCRVDGARAQCAYDEHWR